MRENSLLLKAKSLLASKRLQYINKLDIYETRSQGTDQGAVNAYISRCSQNKELLSRQNFGSYLRQEHINAFVLWQWINVLYLSRKQFLITQCGWAGHKL